jgi:hypothetical protein
MAYSTANPPTLMTMGPLAAAGRHWFYSSADIATDVDTAGYITNGGDLGMKVGDLVFVQVTGTGVITTHRVVTVSSTAPGAVNLGDGTVVGATGNTD